jgi:hypothetical protein
MRLCSAFLLILGVSAAHAESLRPQLQIDGGLSVIGAGYEQPLGTHIALQAETFIFGTYFLPWFDRGHDVKGIGVGLRPTWFANESGHGLYVTPFVRAMSVGKGSPFGADGEALETGAFVGWAFRLATKLDLRVGGGVQYIYSHAVVEDQVFTTSTPFVAIDAVLGWRL